MTDYTTADRIVLLRDVTFDEMKQKIDDQKLEDILCDRYPDFVRMCEAIESDRENIESVTAVYEDEQVKFQIKMKK